MDQARLREYETRCIQEEPPFCQAACPLHVDARGVCRALGEGGTDAALATLMRSLPLPRLLTRLCEEPCKAACKRRERGGSLEMRALERFCVERGTPPRPPLIPPAGKRIAVVGSGISSLTAAWDLCRRGHSVTIFHGPEIGGVLKERAPEDLAVEVEALKKMKAAFEPRDGTFSIKNLTERYESVYAGLDDGIISMEGGVEPVSFQTSIPRVFAGGFADTFIERASQGRRAAQSIVRDLQGASLTAGREREGAFETRLYTSLEGVADAPGARLDDAPDPEAIGQEAKRCLDCQCLECVKVCRYLRAYGGYPKRYAREIYNNLSVVQGSRTANKMINSCTNCGLCAAVCPNGFHMGTLCLEARREMVRQGKMPPSAHEFALLDMDRAVGPPVGRGVKLFFPGCQMTASDPELALRVFAFLRDRAGVSGVWSDCCGAPASWAGREGLFGEKLRTLEMQWKAAGEPELILACSACLQTFRKNAPTLKITPLWEVLKAFDFPAREDARPFTLFAPCTLRDNPSLVDVITTLALSSGTKLQDNTPAEGGNGCRGHAPCCGYGGLQGTANPELADATAREIADRTGTDLLVACAMCRDRFASIGKRAAHLLDLLFPAEDGGDPAARPAPRWSERFENRERLHRILRNETPDDKTEVGHRMKLIMSDEVKTRLDRRRILDGEVRAVVCHAETTGTKTTSPEGVSVAGLKQGNVTTWVEYTMEDEESAHIRNAWTHRMLVRGMEEAS